MSYIEEVLEKFQALPDDIKKYFDDKKVVNYILGLEERYKIDLKFLVMLTAVKEIELLDIEDYIVKKYGKSLQEAKEIKAKLIFNIFQPISDILYPELSKRPFDISANKKIVIEAFSKKLVDIISGHPDLDIQSLNAILIHLIFEDKNFKRELLQTLLNNQEKLTHKTFILDGQPARPTVANWLKDFIKQNGTGMFSNLVLSKYLTNSPNAKELSFEERRLVGKLLNTYRNLKFFPESMKNLPPEEWQIIPVTTTPQPTKARTLVGPKVKPEDVIAEFDKLAQQYPAGSLERKAIEEEKKRYIEKYEEVKRNS